MNPVKIWLLFTCLYSLGPLVFGATYKVTDHVYFEVAIDGQPQGKIVIGLFGDIVPKTVKNFITLATTGVKARSYANTPFHRIIKHFMIQGGDVLTGDGSGMTSIYGSRFDDENFIAKHSSPGFISMANAGPNTNACQFFIITRPAPWLDGKNVVFGKVVEGMDIITKIENVKTYANDYPMLKVYITESGTLFLQNPYDVSDDENSLLTWIKVSIVPLSMSFTILAVFHWFFKKLDF